MIIEREKYLRLIGNKIRELRAEKNLSQFKLAELSDIHENYLGAIERAEKNPTVYTLYKITSALGINMEEFFKNL